MSRIAKPSIAVSSPVVSCCVKEKLNTCHHSIYTWPLHRSSCSSPSTKELHDSPHRQHCSVRSCCARIRRSWQVVSVADSIREDCRRSSPCSGSSWRRRWLCVTFFERVARDDVRSTGFPRRAASCCGDAGSNNYSLETTKFLLV